MAKEKKLPKSYTIDGDPDPVYYNPKKDKRLKQAQKRKEKKSSTSLLSSEGRS